MTSMDRHYDYRPKWAIIVLTAVFFGAGALFLGVKAQGNDRGLIINGVIELSPEGATVFHWTTAAIGLGFVVAAAFLAVMRLTVHQRITVTATGIAIPRSRWSADAIAVPFGQIIEWRTSRVFAERFLTVVYHGGKFTLAASMLPGKDDFDDIHAAIGEGVNAARAHAM
jgi:hypothetical protein